MSVKTGEEDGRWMRVGIQRGVYAGRSSKLRPRSDRSDECKSGRGGWALGLCALVGLVALVVYAATAQRGVSWQDSGHFQHYVLTGTFTNLGGGGLAVVHPWYLKTAHWFCLCFPATWRLTAVNAYSGVGAAVALALCALLLLQLTQRVTAVAAGVITLGLAHMVWWLATVAEVYTWSLAFLFAELLCLLRVCRAESETSWRYAWYGLLFLNGMHASLHNAAFLNLPVYGALWLFSRSTAQPQGWGRVWFGLFCAFSWLVGAVLLVAMVLHELGAGNSLLATLQSLLVGDRYGAIVLGIGGVDLRLALANLALAGVSFISPCWLFAFASVRQPCCDGKLFRRALLALTAIQAFFWIRYFVPDQATFVVPTLGLAAVWLGMGAARCQGRSVATLLAIGVCMQILLPPVLAQTTQRFAVRARLLPFRDEARYWLVPWKHNERSAQQFVEAVDQQLSEGDLLIGDLTAVNPIMAAWAAKTVSSACQLLSEWAGETEAEKLARAEAALSEGRRAYVISPVPGYAPAAILERFDFVREGVLWRIKEKR
ncbi:MAG TPA: hypothetical protein PL016_05310 [Kiritimatiellia bacterium]|nr:hypothetical protein [Kiritimatiellia bacterium]